MDSRFLRLFFSSLLALPLAACGDASPAEEDLTPPTLVSTSPTDGATGVRSDASVVLVFSKPMDQTSVVDALDTGDLGEVSLSWNGAGDTLTITPLEPLEYAVGAGTNPGDTEPYSYVVTLADDAYDLNGNALEAGTEVEFSTLKEISHTFETIEELTDSLHTAGPLGQWNPFVGDMFFSQSAHGVRTLVTFDIALLPSAAVEIASATFATQQLTEYEVGAPYGDPEEGGLGTAVLIDHVTYAALDADGYHSSETAHAHLGEFCVADQEIIEKDVTAAIEDDRVHRDARAGRSQFLLRFEQEANDNEEMDAAVISREEMELRVTYLAP